MESVSGLPAHTARRLETFLDGWMVDNDVPGLSVAVLDRDGLRYAEGMGARNVASKAPATPETLYSVASVTKTFTALATLQLVERGDLALDDEIRAYTEFWADVPGDPITVHELLSHGSGMPLDYAGERQYLFTETPPTSPLVTRADDLRHANGAADTRIEDPEGFLYSNRGYLILGEIIETVADRSHAEFVEQELFAPLGMERSRVGYGKLSEAADDVMTGYAVEDGAPVEVEHDLAAEVRPPYSAGGILSSVTELARLIRCLLAGGELEGTRVLGADLVEAMCSHQAPTWSTVDGGEQGYGYGLKLWEFLGETLVGHTGTAGVSRAYAGMLPERGLGVILGVNTAVVDIGELAQAVLAIVAGEAPERVVPSISLARKLAAVTGTYEGYRGGVTATVEPAESGSHLVVSYRDGPGWTFPAFPESTAHDEYAFYTVRSDGQREPITFREVEEGLVMRCNIDRLERTSTGIADAGENE